jgi:hypothetical protein
MKSEVHIRNIRLKHLEPLLWKWISINKSYSATFDDGLYWYNERATLSSLAGAAWKCGEYALEEFHSDKSYGQDKWLGRADLWFSWKRTEYLIESKQAYLSLSAHAEHSFEKITRALQAARKDATASKNSGKRYLGVAFVVPYVPPSQMDNISSLLRTFIDELYEIDYDLMAYYFQNPSEVLKTEDGYGYPGVVMLGRVPRRS